MKTGGNNPKNRKASVLVLVLIVVSAMTVIVTALVYRTRIAIKLSSDHAERVKAYYLAAGGIERVRAMLANAELDEKGIRGVCHFEGSALAEGLLEYEKATEEQDFSLFYGVSDELSRFNINNSDPACWENLPGVSTEMRSCIQDWIDGDSDTNPSGAENDYYQGLPLAISCKNSEVTNLKELCYIKNVGVDVYRGGKFLADFQQSDEAEAEYGLIDFFTVCGEGKVNINTASREVLSALAGLDGESPNVILNYLAGADGIAGNEDDNCITSAEKLATIDGLSELQIELLEQYCCFSSKYLRILSFAKIHSNKCCLTATIEVLENNTKIISTERLL